MTSFLAFNKVQFSCNKLHCRNLALEVATSYLHQRCMITRPFMTGRYVSKVLRPKGLLLSLECS